MVGIVRRPDAVPCGPCAAGEWDFCANGEYTERGIKQLHGYGSERWRVEPEFAIKLDPELGRVGVLLEPTAVVAKAWEQIERIGARATFAPHRVLVTGAGPIGLLAALLATQRGYEVHVLDRVTDGPKPELVARLGGTYHAHDASAAGQVDIVVEATGAPAVVAQALRGTTRNGIVCLTGVSSGGRPSSSTSAASTATRCSRTTWCSAPSTPTAATMRRPPRRSARPTATGCAR